MTTTTSSVAPAPRVLKHRMRLLTYLAIATGISVLLAVLAVWLRAESVQPTFAPEKFFPALGEKINDVATISVEGKSSAFTVTRKADGTWVLPGKSSYPANVELIRKTVIALSELQAVERRTARADWHERLGLGLPKNGGSGTTITLKDSAGNVLASLITGASAEGASAGGRNAVYARRAGEDQTYVALGDYSAQTDQAQWLDKTFIEFARDRIKTVALKPFKGPTYAVTRDKAEDANFHLTVAIPRGRELRTPTEPNGVGNALMGISFDDVQPASQLDFANAAYTSYVTFDGLTLSLRAIEKERDFWVTVNAISNVQREPAPSPAAAAPGAPKEAPLKPDIAKEAAQINKMTAGWAYKIPRYKGVLITAPIEDLLKPLGGPPPGPAMQDR